MVKGCRYARRQTAAPAAHQNLGLIQSRRAGLFGDFQTDAALTGDHIQIING